jgi:DNA-binding NarL/FixJ family response regulator
VSSAAIPLHRTIVTNAKHRTSRDILEPLDKPSPGTLFLIGRRTLARDCLVNAIGAMRTGRISAFDSVGDFLACNKGVSGPYVIVYCIHVMQAETQRLQHEILGLASGACDIPVVVVSDINNSEIIDCVLRAGAKGFIPSTIPLQVAVQAIKIVEAGGSYMPAEAMLASHRTEPEPAKMEPVGGLTPRQVEVLQELRQGKANKVIALNLNMRESTVKVHVRCIMRKLHARNRTEVSFITNRMFSAKSGIAED